MMGYGHAAMGAAGWLALTTTSHLATGAAPQDPTVVALGAVMTAGAALLPDLDHHSGTIAHAVPPVTIAGHTIIPSPTQALARLVERASGGHRHLTHSLIGILAAGAGAALLAQIRLPSTWVAALAGKAGWQVDPTSIGGGHGANIGVLATCVLLVAFAAKALRLTRISGASTAAHVMRSWVGPWAVGLTVGTWAATLAPVNWAITLPAIVTLGTFIHCLGDTLTTQGVAWAQPWQHPAPRKIRAAAKKGNPAARLVCYLWPPNGYLRVPVLGTAGSTRETIFSALLVTYSLYLIAYSILTTIHPPAAAILP